MKLTNNFFLSEFTDEKESDVCEYQMYLIKLYATNLQILRDYLGPKVTLNLTSGVRDPQVDIQRLIQQGYNPSRTSDHFYGKPATLIKGSVSYLKFGETYSFSVGAGDVVSTKKTAREVFEAASTLSVRGKVNFGQIIYEEHPKKDGSISKWVHMSNDYDLIYSPSIVKFLGRDRYLITYDGGKNFTKYSPIK